MANNPTLTASVVVPAHNAAASIGRQLEALANQQDAPPFEVIVVANRCTDDTAVVARSFSARVPGLSVVVADGKASAAYARNVGARSAQSPNLLFCDADDEVGPQWVRALVEGLATADIVGGRMEPEAECVPTWLRRLPGTPTEPQDGLTLFDGRIWYPPTCCFGCHRDDFEAAGGFDESFVGANSEDLELTMRMLENGARLGLAPEALFKYAIRTDLRSYVRQQAGYRAADAMLLAKVGRLNPPLPFAAELKRLVRRLAHDLIRKHVLDPRSHLALVQLRLANHRSHRSAWKTQAKRAGPDDALDAVLPVDTPVVGGIAIRTRSGVAGWWATKGAEPLSLRALEVLLPERGTFVDVGANVGVFSLAGGRLVGRTGLVSSFEPDPRSRSLLEQNLSRHGIEQWVTVAAQAVGDENLQRTFPLAENDLVSGFAESPHFGGSSNQAIQVQQVRLDTAVSGRVDVLKIDVEGWELYVLLGARELLARNPEASILCEINPDSLAVANVAINDVLDLLRDGGRRTLVVLEDDHSSPWAGQVRALDDVVAWIESGGGSRWYANVLAVPHSRVEDLGDIGLLVQAGTYSSTL